MANPNKEVRFKFQGQTIPLDKDLYKDLKDLKIPIDEVIKYRAHLNSICHPKNSYNTAAIIIIDKRRSKV